MQAVRYLVSARVRAFSLHGRMGGMGHLLLPGGAFRWLDAFRNFFPQRLDKTATGLGHHKGAGYAQETNALTAQTIQKRDLLPGGGVRKPSGGKPGFQLFTKLTRRELGSLCR